VVEKLERYTWEKYGKMKMELKGAARPSVDWIESSGRLL
jgi:hypothetical protein